MKQRSQKTWFEIRLSAVIDPFLEEARQLCEEWKEIELAASDSGEEVPLCFCHGDYQYHNILRQDRGFFLVNFEKCQADGPVRACICCCVSFWKKVNGMPNGASASGGL